MMTKRMRFLEFATLIFLIIIMFLILVLGITHPANNLLSWQMAVGVLIGTVFLCAVTFFWNRGMGKISRMAENKRIWRIGVLIYGIVVWGLSLLCRNAPNSLVDYNVIYDAAEELAAGKEMSRTDYFLVYSNNFKPMLFLSAIFRFAGYGESWGGIASVVL